MRNQCPALRSLVLVREFLRIVLLAVGHLEVGLAELPVFLSVGHHFEHIAVAFNESLPAVL